MSIPYLSHVLNGWIKKRTVKVMTKTVVNHIPTEVPSESETDMLIVPMPSEKIARKPEEQRSWKWYTVYTKDDLGLKTDDQIFVDEIAYRIQARSDFSEAGFYEYEAIKDFQSSSSSTT